LLRDAYQGVKDIVHDERFVVGPGEGRHLDLGSFEALATAPQTSGEFTLLQLQREPPDFGPPLQLHHHTAEAFYVLEGEYLMYIGNRKQLCPRGTFVYVPRNTPHSFKVVSAVRGKKLNLFSPAAVLFFWGARRGGSGRNCTPEVLDVIGARNNVEVIGPVPDAYLWTEQPAQSGPAHQRLQHGSRSYKDGPT
jgi:mannose-6-phosphate isomerase-like protein (cupin superfamily)